MRYSTGVRRQTNVGSSIPKPEPPSGMSTIFFIVNAKTSLFRQIAVGY
jgi:hypothetical protein